MQVFKTENFQRSSFAPLNDLHQARKIKILIVYDGSENADAALDDLSRAGLPSAVRLTKATSQCWRQ